MAGNYPDPPSRRMSYDRDGTIGVYVDNNSGIVTKQTSGVMAAMNDDSLSIGITFPDTPYNAYAGIIFPQLRDLAAYFLVTDYTGVNTIQFSPDTTTLVDGTWTTLKGTGVAAPNNTVPYVDAAFSPYYRTNITPLVQTGVRALRFGMSGGNNPGFPRYRALHLYGTIPDTQTPDRLSFRNPTTDTVLLDALMDFGNAAQGTTATKTFRVKNLSSSLTAAGLILSLQPNPDVSPTLIGQFQFSPDGTTWSNTLAISDLGPGVISPVLYVRRNTSLTAVLSLMSPRILLTYTTFQ